MSYSYSAFHNACVNHIANHAQTGYYPASLHESLAPDDCYRAIADIRQWPQYAPTPLRELPELSAWCGVDAVFYKDESRRFAPGSFKSLGGAYAVVCLLKEQLRGILGKTPDTAALAAGEFLSHTQNIIITTATDGNHGRSVAWGAKQFGCQSRIFIHAEVSAARQRAMEELGAQVVRIKGNYDDSVRAARDAAAANGWFLVADTSFENDVLRPKQVMAGYTLMVDEIAAQLPGDQLLTHVFVQGGVGGLAAAVGARWWQNLAAHRPRLIIVEPAWADCLWQSARRQKLTFVEVKQETIMAGLSCGEPSLLAWNILQAGAHDFITIEDKLIPPAMRLLARQNVESGESGAAGVAGLLAVAANDALRQALNLQADSRVLAFGTEGATDAEIYRRLVEDEIGDEIV